MAESLVWYAGNRNPSISENIVDSAGNVIDLTGKTVKFKARELNSATLLVDQAVSNVPGADGLVRYDWSAADIDPAALGGIGGALSKERDLLVWWEVTTSGKTQDMAEAMIRVEAHAPETKAYAEVEEVKSTLDLAKGFANRDIERAVVSASRVVDKLTGRRFYLDADANQLRYYTPSRSGRVYIDDLVALTWLKTDPSGSGSYSDTWTAGDYVLEPLNADAEGRPWEWIDLYPTGNFDFPYGYPRSIEVKGKFGWPTVPEAVKDATILVTSKIFVRIRQSPHGVISVGVDGTPVRFPRFDPTLEELLAPYTKAQVLA